VLLHAKLTVYSGIFGYINYLVEKDRKFILDTLVNGRLLCSSLGRCTVDADSIQAFLA